ncbi:MAG: hypothetical protein L3J67_13875, partial [Hyphomicrobiaceae bacterium]|nr:hypothetical protein [Hyphomicrobiaceae bacterium]
VGPLAILFGVFITLFLMFYSLGVLLVIFGLLDSLVIVVPLLTFLYLSGFDVSRLPLFPTSLIQDSEQSTAFDKKERQITVLFHKWLLNRPDYQNYKSSNRPYPVFIFAAQGGGAYAASHAAFVLASLQDANPLFSSHVFATSGVSGGAVGLTLFAAINKALPRSLTATGKREFGRGPRNRILRKIITGRHASALMAQLPGEIVTSWRGRHDRENDRSSALRNSYLSMVKKSLEGLGKSLPAPTEPDMCKGTTFLEQCYYKSWTPRSNSPALILNATSVETGKLAAFSPFDFVPKQFGSTAPESFTQWFEGSVSPLISTLDAAIVSARFPGILPAYTYRHEKHITNFVDGGYADSSGASTAYSIYKALEKAATSLNVNLDLNLIILTRPDKPSGKKVDGTRLVDTLAPLYAVLKVRDQQARREINHVREAFKKSTKKLMFIKLPVRRLNLPLAWSIAPATYDAIGKTVGAPELCVSLQAGNKQELHSLVVKNSCILQKILLKLKVIE